MADDDPLALCQRELAAIVAATETAVTDILGAIEALRDAPPAARAAAITEIVAACQYPVSYTHLTLPTILLV